VGKTCLARKLLDQSFDIVGHKEEVASTRGIDILELHVKTRVTDDLRSTSGTSAAKRSA